MCRLGSNSQTNDKIEKSFHLISPFSIVWLICRSLVFSVHLPIHEQQNNAR